jgi:hypothetical protein
MTPWWTNHPSLDANQTPYMANHNSAAAPNPWVTLALTCTTTQIWVMPIQDWLNFGSGEQVSRIPIWKRILAVTWITKEDIELSSQLTNALSCQAMKALCCLRPRSTAIERGLRVEDAQEFATPPPPKAKCADRELAQGWRSSWLSILDLLLQSDEPNRVPHLISCTNDDPKTLDWQSIGWLCAWGQSWCSIQAV